MKDAEIYARDSQGSLQVVRSNPNGELSIAVVAGFIDSVVAIGDVVADAADTGSSPVKIGGVARQANPSAVAAGDRVSATFDDVGRQVMQLYQVRDLFATALAQTVTLAEVQLLAGVSGVFHDLLEITAANTTGAVRTLDIRDTAGSGAVVTMQIPANSTVTQHFVGTKPQNEAGNAWTIINSTTGLSDISGENIVVSATFVKNV